MRLLGILKDALEIVVSEIERLGFSISPTSNFCLLTAYSSSFFKVISNMGKSAGESREGGYQ